MGMERRNNSKEKNTSKLADVVYRNINVYIGHKMLYYRINE